MDVTSASLSVSVSQPHHPTSSDYLMEGDRGRRKTCKIKKMQMQTQRNSINGRRRWLRILNRDDPQLQGLRRNGEIYCQGIRTRQFGEVLVLGTPLRSPDSKEKQECERRRVESWRRVGWQVRLLKNLEVEMKRNARVGRTAALRVQDALDSGMTRNLCSFLFQSFSRRNEVWKLFKISCRRRWGRERSHFGS